MSYRTTTQVRIKKATLERLRSLSYEQREDMVDLLNLAVALLERELFKTEGKRVVFPVVSTEVQLPLGVSDVSVPVAPKVSFSVTPSVTRQGFQVESEVRNDGG